MAGLIASKMGSAQDEEMEQEPIEGAGPDGGAQHEGMEGEAPEQGDNSMSMDPESVRKGMKLPKGMEAAYDRIIKAGLKVMFDPSTREETAAFIEESGGDPAKMAEGVTAVVISLFQQSNSTIPPNLLIPAGIELLVHAADVAGKSGMEIGKEQIAQAMSEVVKQILTKFGATPEQMQKLMSGMDSGQQPGQVPQGA
jgi:hypothetical protein